MQILFEICVLIISGSDSEKKALKSVRKKISGAVFCLGGGQGVDICECLIFIVPS